MRGIELWEVVREKDRKGGKAIVLWEVDVGEMRLVGGGGGREGLKGRILFGLRVSLPLPQAARSGGRDW